MLLGFSPMDFQTMKVAALDATGLAKDALHIYAGLAVFLIVRLLWRRRGGWVLAWLAALLVASGVEYIDLLAENSNTGLQPDAEHWHDIWNTMFWPTVLLLIGRWLQPKELASEAQSDDESGELPDQPLEQTPAV